MGCEESCTVLLEPSVFHIIPGFVPNIVGYQAPIHRSLLHCFQESKARLLRLAVIGIIQLLFGHARVTRRKHFLSPHMRKFCLLSQPEENVSRQNRRFSLKNRDQLPAAPPPNFAAHDPLVFSFCVIWIL